MRVKYHEISDDMFAELAAGTGGGRAVEQLNRMQFSKHALLVRSLLGGAARNAPADRAGGARRGYELLAAAQRRSPDAVRAVLSHPAVGGWAWRTARALAGGPIPPGPPVPAGLPGSEEEGVDAEAAGLGRLAAVAAAAAIRARMEFSIEVPVTGGLVLLPSLGAATLAGPDPGLAATVRSTGAGTEVAGAGGRVVVPPDPWRDAPGWRPLRRISATAGGLSITLTIDDMDPFRMPAARIRDRLRDEETTAWQADLTMAWDLLARHHPA